jgi:hypothetical protein
MTWNLEEIERDWIYGKVSSLAASADSVVAAFDRTERALGRDWIEKSRISVGTTVWGLAPTLGIESIYCVLGTRVWQHSYIRELANGKPTSE